MALMLHLPGGLGAVLIVGAGVVVVRELCRVRMGVDGPALLLDEQGLVHHLYGTKLNVLVVHQHQGDAGAYVSVVPLKPAFQVVVWQERGTPTQQRENSCREQAKQDA